MKTTLLTAGALALACLNTSACSTLGAGSNNSALTDGLLKIATDPNCTHADVLDVMLGPIPSGHIHLERSGCATPAGVPAPPAPAAQAAAAVGVAPTSFDTAAPPK
jgi:hypothetical protein